MRLFIVAVSVCFVAGAAQADEPIKWTGGYVGAHVGGLWGDVDVRNDPADGVSPGPFSYSVDGVFGGGTAGYNWQFSQVVAGIEVDLGYLDPDGAGIIPSSSPGHRQNLTLDSGLYGDVTARLGVAFDRTLIYVKGGYAFLNSEAMQATTKPQYSPTPTGSFDGWTLGGGIEHFITPSLSIKAEYQHFDFGTEQGAQTTIAADPPTPVGHVFENWHDVTIDTVKVGLNYHFKP